MIAHVDTNRRLTYGPRPGRRARLRLLATSVVAVVVSALATVAWSPSPVAAQAILTVSPATGLDPDGAFVVVSGRGYEPGAQVFVMQCRSTSTDDHTCNSVGLRKVTVGADGTFTANAMRLVGRFGATDCTLTTCSVMTSAVSDHSENRSLDVAAPISFAAPAPPPSPEPTSPAPVAPAPQGPAPTDPAPPVTEAPSGGDPAPASTAPGDPTTSSSTTTSTEAATSADDPSTETETEDDDDEVAAAAAPADPGDGDSGAAGSGGSSTVLVVGVLVALAAVAAFVLSTWRRRTPVTS